MEKTRGASGIENLLDLKVKVIRCNNGTEFKNKVMNQFCEIKGIKREFSVARTPQQNGVAERKNRTLIEATKTMLADSKLPTTFWAKVVNTAYYVQNRVFVIKPHNKTRYELFLGYSTNNKAFWVFNNRTGIVEENLDVKFSEDTPNIARNGPNWLFDIDALTKSMNYELVVAGNQSNGIADLPFSSSLKDSPDAGFKPIGEEEKKSVEHPENEDYNIVDENIVYGSVDDLNMPNLEEIVYSDDDEDVDAEADMTNLDTHILVSPIPTTKIHKDHPLEQIIGDIHSAPQTRIMTKSVSDHVEPKKKIWTLVDLPYGKRAIRTKWIYRNKKDERVARIEAIRLFLAYASFKDFVVYQIDVKSAFRYGKIKEEVYVCQPLGFEDPELTDRVYKDTRIQRGQIDKTLFIKRVKGDILLVQVYVNDIIFGSTKKSLCTEFEKLMHKKFQMSSIGELTLFLGLQVTQKDDGIFISQDKYVDEILKKFGFSTIKTTSTPMETSKSLMKDDNAEDVDYPKDSPFDLEAYTDSDYAGASLDRKSITGEYVVELYLLWTVKNLVFHSKTKHIEIRHHFIRDSYEKRLIQVIKIHTDHNVADLLTKAFDIDDWNGLEMLRMKLGLKLCCQAKVNAARLLTTARLPLELQLLRVFLVYKRNTSLIENADFDEIVDFLNASPIRYALTYDIPSHTKKVFANMKRKGKDFQGLWQPYCLLYDVIHLKKMLGKGLVYVKEGRQYGKGAATTAACLANARARIMVNLIRPIHGNTYEPILGENGLGVNILGSGEDRLKIMELMEIYTKLSNRVLALENVKIA
ncbi:putative ribonuclease H-like domain-containing protein [Tanacetum coccineum]|uniref:Ribonuclease H-like domain-containing protein n=1 Tax=Tanacetum coccineum TaxID=301880 RepID=A0ABQ5JB22_9ASTR